MKKIIFIFSAILTVIMIFAALPFTAFADDVYTVRVFAGEQGTIGGQTYIEVRKAYGEYFEFDYQSEVQVNGTLDEDGQIKYQVLGIRETGKEDLHATTFMVTGDIDLVVAYGLTGNLVQYTVHYMYGTTELGSDSYYSYDGERAIAAAKYFDGYIPLYRNITGTVRSGQSNDWNLEYALATAGATEAAAEAAAGEAVAGGEAVAAAAEGEAAAGGEAAVAGEEAGAAAGGEGQTEQPAVTTQDVYDIDNPDVPLAAGNTTETTSVQEETETTMSGGEKTGISTLGTIGIVAGGVVVVGGIVAAVVATRKNKKD